MARRQRLESHTHVYCHQLFVTSTLRISALTKSLNSQPASDRTSRARRSCCSGDAGKVKDGQAGLLADGPVPTNELKAAAAAHGHSWAMPPAVPAYLLRSCEAR